MLDWGRKTKIFRCKGNKIQTYKQVFAKKTTYNLFSLSSPNELRDIGTINPTNYAQVTNPNFCIYLCFHSFHSSTLHIKKKTDTKKSHYKVAKQLKKRREKDRNTNFSTKKVDFHLVDSIRNDKFAAEIFTHLPQLKEILTISLHLSFTKSYRK